MLTRIAEVCINVQASRLRHPFSYIVPQEYPDLEVGWRVVVPFGSSDAEGFVLAIRPPEQNEDLTALKSIRDVPDDEPWFDEEMLKTAQWLSDYYVCSLGEALRLFIPGKSGVRTEKFYRISPDFEPTETSGAVYDFIRQKGPVAFGRLRAEFGAVCRSELVALVRDGLILSSRQTRQRVTEKWARVLCLIAPIDQLNEILATWKGKPAQKRLLERLAAAGNLPVSKESGGIAWDSAAKALVQAGLACEKKVRLQRDSYCEMTGTCAPVIATQAQQAALDKILPAIQDQKAHTFLLYGVTGSGKTEVYLQATAAALAAGRQALVMIPEIAQTSQLLRRFKARFGPEVAVVHSRLSVAERRDVWDLFRNREIGIVIGTRSALFLPGAHLGLIIMDEEHEFTYKQEESPRYHVRETALRRAALLGATVILGSATPALESYHAAMSGRYTLLDMPTRVDGSTLPTVEVVDMREQLKLGRKSVVSAPLEQLLKETKDKEEQAILLLNRRGHSTFIMCRECGYVMRCEHCSVPLVFHMHGGKLRCHYCDSYHVVPTTCPSCHGKYIRYFGAGTQRLEEELTAILPGIRLTRMDQDTTGGKTGHDKMLDEFRAGKSDILLGTQMVAKGHDIENVTAVGVLAADSSLNLPDFRAAERSFALVMQAAGRAGRGAKAGRVVVQTYHPEHYALQAGAAQDYAAFYKQEIDFRAQLQYPPFTSFLKLTTTGKDEAQTMKVAEDMAAMLRERFGPLDEAVEILGPFVAPVSKIGDVFRVHTLLRGKNLSDVKKMLVDTGIAWNRDVIVDVDPLGMM
ncbi:MAG TPA: primosomal protein N' [Negativicutes bacterium]|nr:primosomal protein N' [Negativicutes bacterium]